MKASTKAFEKKFNRRKRIIEKRGLAMFKAMFRNMGKQVVERLNQLPEQNWVDAPEIIKEKQVFQAFVKFYTMHTPLAIMTRNHLLKGKADAEDVLWYEIFDKEMRNIVETKAGIKITSITGTTKDKWQGLIREILAEGNADGLGIEKIKQNIVKGLGDNIRGNAYARARAIAQTEMISASNQASMAAAKSTGYETRKFWSTSGLSDVRESHRAAENQSSQVNGLKENEPFVNGLMYPGDPNGLPKEVINCRCTILHEII